MGTMATQSPFSLLEGFLQNFNIPLSPPAWAVDEMHRRTVLLLNHVLMQEPQAMERLARQKGRVILMQWRTFTFHLLITPAGLLDLADAQAKSDLTLLIADDNPIAIVQALMQGGKPAVRIEGDVQLAAEVNWLVDHVRWDIEEDLARLMGDAPAHGLVLAAKTMAKALQQFVGGPSSGGGGGHSA
jgi:ubiquinone biosynthesis protein UbiJ